MCTCNEHHDSNNKTRNYLSVSSPYLTDIVKPKIDLLNAVAGLIELPLVVATDDLRRILGVSCFVTCVVVAPLLVL